MDPNIALDKLREMCRRALDEDSPEDIESDLAEDICEAFEALDQWLSNGGFLPSEWRQPADTLRGVP